MTQKWKTDASLYDAPTEKDGVQVKKKLDYDTTYRKEFLDSDPLRDWESIERCKWLWEWAIEQIDDDPMNWAVLDVGTKDGQFPEWLREQSIMGLGLEYSESYVRYAVNKGRPVKYGNACAMEFDDDVFDFVFSHHLHGLLPDYAKGIEEMMRVSRKYMLCLNQVPGNPRKHYSYIDSPTIYHNFVEFGAHTVGPFEVLYNDYLDTGFNNEWVLFVKKIGYESIEESIEMIDDEIGSDSITDDEGNVIELEPKFKKKKPWSKFF
jgi:SAM-dependent methyltransferase